jgi:hypothetical protein
LDRGFAFALAFDLGLDLDLAFPLDLDFTLFLAFMQSPSLVHVVLTAANSGLQSSKRPAAGKHRAPAAAGEDGIAESIVMVAISHASRARAEATERAEYLAPTALGSWDLGRSGFALEIWRASPCDPESRYPLRLNVRLFHGTSSAARAFAY